MSRPVIGITMRHDLATERFYLARDYSEAIEACGGVPLHISLIPQPEYIQSLMEHLDGVLLPGSASDVDPLRYGREPHPKLGEVHPLKDETDKLVMEEVERRGVPLLAICFGMQWLNVARGGTLMQDIGSEMPQAIKHEQGAPRTRHSHRVRLLAESLLGNLAGAESVAVNSHHHQAIDVLGENLRATSWAADGLVESIEDVRTDRFVLGVQWHPEIAWRTDKFSQSIFQIFINATKSSTQIIKGTYKAKDSTHITHASDNV
ncbi:MAG: gamma-glutamyl-gamma-aminobutyrate hydrolase family protein [Pyrinomonadaceae bacterium]|nr:gamma-glutamyl-gamma-aminobutyrate hydrolase family protein [Pyrinomonadaceae bacterium]